MPVTHFPKKAEQRIARALCNSHQRHFRNGGEVFAHAFDILAFPIQIQQMAQIVEHIDNSALEMAKNTYLSRVCVVLRACRDAQE